MRFSSRVACLALSLIPTAQCAFAAEVYVDSSPTSSGIAYAIYWSDAGLGEYNVIGVDIYPDAPAEFLNFDNDGIGGPTFFLAPGSDYSFSNPLPYAFVYGPAPWANIGMFDDGPRGISYGAGPLGAWIELYAPPLFLNNVVLPVGATGTATITAINTGITVFSQTVRFGIPEPGSLVLAGLGLVGCLLRRSFTK